MSEFNPYQTGEQSVGGTLSPGELAKRAERERCISLVRCRADIARESAAMLRKAGTWNTAWPFCKPHYAVHHNWERAARVHDELAKALDQIEEAIIRGRQLKEGAHG